MKMKRWLSRGIVLAMIVAMMVPMPVAAKSSKSSKKSGKLIKSATFYRYDNGSDEKYGTADDKWQLVGKVGYTYDKKGNPTEKKQTYYTDFFLNIPTSANVTTTTMKYKYKGKKLKSMTMTNEAGFITQKRYYTGGKVTSYGGSTEVSTRDYWGDETGKENSKKYNGSLAYNKAGNVIGDCIVMGYTEDGAFAGYREYNSQYYLNTKNGLPTYMYESLSNGKFTAPDGTVTTEDFSDYGDYASFNDKGLVVQNGWYDKQDAKYRPYYNYQYVVKKGLVKEAYVLAVHEGKEVFVGKVVFDYNKTKISKQRYKNMINSHVMDRDYDDEDYGWGIKAQMLNAWF